MSQQNDNAVPVVIVVVAIAFALLALKFARMLGADWSVTLTAMIWSVIAAVGSGGALWFFFRGGVCLFSSGISAAVWPNWWAVLDNMAANRNGAGIGKLAHDNPFYIADTMQQSFWWNGALFTVGIEAVLVALFLYCLFQRIYNR